MLRRGGTCVLNGLPQGEISVSIFDLVLNGYTFRGSIAGAVIQELVGRGNRLQGGSLVEIVNVPSGSLLCQADSGQRESPAVGVAVTVAVRC
jgi:hypothetical protein